VLATVLLQEAKAAEALRTFEAVLSKEPNRYRAFAGAMQAAERAGDAKKAAFFAERVLEQTAVPTRPGLRSPRPAAFWAGSVMRWARLVPGALLAIGLGVSAPGVDAAESDPLPVPEGGARQRAVVAYNAGAKLMVDKHYAAAQQKFEEALAADEKLAEAHNNLAFSLRMQSPTNRERALKHYNRALELKPNLAQAYMYRGVLFTQMGDLKRARADHAKLLALDRNLAANLERVIAGVGRDDGDGLAAQYD
jgi:tetratricopeptide (TPR) repeat protein